MSDDIIPPGFIGGLKYLHELSNHEVGIILIFLSIIFLPLFLFVIKEFQYKFQTNIISLFFSTLLCLFHFSLQVRMTY